MSEVAPRAAEEFLAAAYPDEREREHAERWLGLMACQGDGQIFWWQIPGLAPVRMVPMVRGVVLGVAVALVMGWGSYVGIVLSHTGLVGAYAIALFFMARWVGARYFTDPLASDPALSQAQAEDPLDAAVDIINQARYAQDQSGPCAGCSVPGNSDDNLPGEAPPEDHVEEP